MSILKNNLNSILLIAILIISILIFVKINKEEFRGNPSMEAVIRNSAESRRISKERRRNK